MENKSEQIFKAVYENAPIGLVLVNSDTTLRSVNLCMFQSFKLPPTSVKAANLETYFTVTQSERIVYAVKPNTV